MQHVHCHASEAWCETVEWPTPRKEVSNASPGQQTDGKQNFCKCLFFGVAINKDRWVELKSCNLLWGWALESFLCCTFAIMSQPGRLCPSTLLVSTQVRKNKDEKIQKLLYKHQFSIFGLYVKHLKSKFEIWLGQFKDSLWHHFVKYAIICHVCYDAMYVCNRTKQKQLNLKEVHSRPKAIPSRMVIALGQGDI